VAATSSAADVVGELGELPAKLAATLRSLQAAAEVSFGCSEKDAVYSEDKLTLYRYRPIAASAGLPPVLIVYALVNRPYMMDLERDRSLIRRMLEQGLDLYLIDWGYPGAADRWLTLEDYIEGYVGDCVDVLRRRHGVEQVNLLGICQGGTFSLCYSSLHPDKVRNLITMVTPVDFHRKEGLLNVWAQYADVDLMVDALGNIPGEFMNFGFLMLRPWALNMRKYIDLLDILDNEKELMNFLRMEKWIFDSPDQAGEAYREFMKDFYIGNKLIKGQIRIGGRPVSLGAVTMPVLNLYGTQDHLVPPSSSMALESYVGTKDYTVASFPVGHIGMYVSGKVQRDLPPLIAEWLKQRS